MTILIKLMDNKNSNRIVIRIERAQLNVVVILINVLSQCSGIRCGILADTRETSTSTIAATRNLCTNKPLEPLEKSNNIHSQWPLLRRSTLYRRMLFLIGSLRFHLKMWCRKKEVEMPIKFDSHSLSLIHSLTQALCIYFFIDLFIHGKMRASKSSSINIFYYYTVIFFSLFRSLTFSLPLSFSPFSSNHCIEQMGN